MSIIESTTHREGSLERANQVLNRFLEARQDDPACPLPRIEVPLKKFTVNSAGEYDLLPTGVWKGVRTHDVSETQTKLTGTKATAEIFPEALLDVSLLPEFKLAEAGLAYCRKFKPNPEATRTLSRLFQLAVLRMRGASSVEGYDLP